MFFANRWSCWAWQSTVRQSCKFDLFFIRAVITVCPWLQSPPCRREISSRCVKHNTNTQALCPQGNCIKIINTWERNLQQRLNTTQQSAGLLLKTPFPPLTCTNMHIYSYMLWKQGLFFSNAKTFCVLLFKVNATICTRICWRSNILRRGR